MLLTRGSTLVHLQQTPQPQCPLDNQGETLDHDEPRLEAEPGMNVPEEEVKPEVEVEPFFNAVSVGMVMVYQIVHCRPHSVSDCIRTTFWLVAGITLAWCELATMLALVISTTWPKCTAQSDCYLGQVCVNLPADSTSWSRSACEDCFYFMGEDPWAHRLPGNTPGNATEICGNMLTHPGNQVLFDTLNSSPSFDGCLYAMRIRGTISKVDQIIMTITTILLSLAIAEDRREQLRVVALRRATLPMWLPSWLLTVGSHLGFTSVQKDTLHCCRGLAQNLACTMVGITTLILHRCVGAVVPVAMVANLITRGATSTDILLNGLSMGFVLALDDLAPSAIHTVPYNERILAWANGIQLYDADSAFRKRPLGFGAPFLVACTATLYTFNLLIDGALNCEQVGMFMLYRIGVTFGVWYTTCMDELLLMLDALCTSLGLLYQRREVTNAWKDILKNFVLRILFSGAESLAESIAAAFIILFNVWFFMQIHWDTELGFGFSEYFLHYVEDIFGSCASGGYVMSFPDGKCVSV